MVRSRSGHSRLWKTLVFGCIAGVFVTSIVAWVGAVLPRGNPSEWPVVLGITIVPESHRWWNCRRTDLPLLTILNVRVFDAPSAQRHNGTGYSEVLPNWAPPLVTMAGPGTQSSRLIKCVMASGFPFRAMWCEMDQSHSYNTDPTAPHKDQVRGGIELSAVYKDYVYHYRALPLRLLPLGFVLNTTIVALIWMAVTLSWKCGWAGNDRELVDVAPVATTCAQRRIAAPSAGRVPLRFTRLMPAARLGANAHPFRAVPSTTVNRASFNPRT